MVLDQRNQAILEGRDLHYAYGSASVLAGVDVSLEQGEILGILGPNGSGKSTLLGLLSGLISPVKGQVLLEGKPIASLSRAHIARTMGLVPQTPEVSPGLSVMETVLAGRFNLMGGRQFENQADEQAAADALEKTGLTALAQRSAGALSGGEAQRLALARALAAEPKLLLLDEPTSALDLDHQMGVMTMLERRAIANGLAVCIVSHDLNLASLFCHKLLLLHGGKALAWGPPEAVLRPELLQKAYGVKTHVDSEPSRGRPRVTTLAPPPPDQNVVKAG